MQNNKERKKKVLHSRREMSAQSCSSSFCYDINQSTFKARNVKKKKLHSFTEA